MNLSVDVVRLIAKYLWSWIDLGNFRLTNRLCARAIDMRKARPVYYWKHTQAYNDEELFLFSWRGLYSYSCRDKDCCYFTIPEYRIDGDTDRPLSFALTEKSLTYTLCTGKLLTRIEDSAMIEENDCMFPLYTGDYEDSRDPYISMDAKWYDAIVHELEQFRILEMETHPALRNSVPHKRIKR